MRKTANLNLAWLEAFDAAARHLNFTRAAEELGVTQGAISIQVRKLETALQAPLFERRGRHVALTDEGVAYHPHVRHALEKLFRSTAHLFGSTGRDRLTISCYSPTFADMWLTPRLPQLLREFPDLEIGLMVDYQTSGRRSERDDLAFVFSPEANGSFEPLFREYLIAVCSPNYRALHGDAWPSGTIIELVGPRVGWSTWSAAAGVMRSKLERRIQVNSMQSAAALARGGSGVALLSRPFIDPFLEDGSLVEILPGRRLVGGYHGLIRSGAADRASIAARVSQWFRQSV